MADIRTDGGRKPRVDDEDILAVFADTDDPVLSTAEVADRLPIQRRGVLDRLRGLEDRGDVASKPIGGRNTVWWRVDAAADREADDGADDVLADVDLPGSGSALENRRVALRAIYDYLRENGTGRRSDFLELVDADEVGYSSPKSFWTNCIKARGALAALPGVESPGEGGHTWKFDGSTDDEKDR